MVEDGIIEKTVTVATELGLHAKVATTMVQTLQKFSCGIKLVKDGVEADGRSILDLLLLAATPGSVIVIQAWGPDRFQAVQTITRLLEHE